MSFGAGMGVGFGAGFGSGIAVGVASGKRQAQEQIEKKIREYAVTHTISIQDTRGYSASIDDLIKVILEPSCDSGSKTVKAIVIILAGLVIAGLAMFLYFRS
jgi:hypothetical protein